MLVVIGWMIARAHLNSDAVSEGEKVVSAISAEPRGVAPPPPPIQRGSRIAEAQTPDDAPSPALASSSAPSVVGSIRLVGRITGPLRARVDDARTTLELGTQDGKRPIPIVDGSYMVESLPPGSYWLHCGSNGFFDVDRAFHLEAAEVEHREDFELTTLWNVAIRLVTSDGRNFRDLDERKELPAGARLEVVATTEPPPDRWTEHSFRIRLSRGASRYVHRNAANPQVPGDPDGTCSGSLEIHVPPPVYVSAACGGIVVATTRLDARDTLATLEIPLDRLRALRCSLRGRVVSAEDGSPIARAQATLYVAGSGVGFESDRNGMLGQEGLLPGSATLMLHTPGRGEEMLPLDLVPGVETDLGTIRLTLGAHIRGRFVDEQGNSARSDAHVVPFEDVDPLTTHAWGMVPTFDVDAGGKFEIDGLAQRKYVVACNPQTTQAYSPRIVDLSAGSVDDLVVEVRRSSIVQLHPTCAEVRSYAWWILSADRIVCARGSFFDELDARASLAPGSFTLCVGRDASSVREIPITVGTEPVAIEVGP
jgi:hypothetical protein